MQPYTRYVELTSLAGTVQRAVNGYGRNSGHFRKQVVQHFAGLGQQVRFLDSEPAGYVPMICLSEDLAYAVE